MSESANIFTAPGVVRIDAAGVYDADRVGAAPGSLLLEVRSCRPAGNEAPEAELVVLASGSPLDVGRHPEAARARRQFLPGHVLIPGLVNAHTHLDLTHLGFAPHDAEGGFLGFVDRVRAGRHADPDAITRSVREGARRSLRAGVVAVGDVVGAVRGGPAPAGLDALRSARLRGVGFLEFFAIGRSEAASLARLREALADLNVEHPRVRAGLQPHAPYSVSRRAYREAAGIACERGMPLATHLSETADEREFVAGATGPNRGFLERLGLWDDALLSDVGRGETPIAHLGDVLAASAFIAAHVNAATDDDLALLARTRTTVAYCPRASDHFGAPLVFGPHRYRDMQRLGIPVALGTDSVLNQPEEDLSILTEMRLLHRRDGVDPREVLRMATIAGAEALFGRGVQGFRFSPGEAPAGLVAIPAARRDDPLRAALRADDAPTLLALGSAPRLP